MSAQLIILDRDGVLNAVCVDPEQGTVDSPLHPSQVTVFPWVPEAIARLTKLGCTVVVATNQPAAAKGKTTLANLQATHGRVLEEAQSAGGVIQGSYICYHRSEDRCKCRKPAPGLLEAAFRDHGGTHRDAVWMVGDGVTDVEAGTRFGAKTAFLGPRKCDACKVFEGCSLKPEFWSDNLLSFVYFLERS